MSTSFSALASALNLTSTLNGAGAIVINASGTTSGITIDALTSGISIDSTGNSNFSANASGNTLTLAAAGGGANQVIINSAGTGANAVRINPTAGGVDVDAVGAIALDSTAGNSNFTVTNSGSTLTLAAAGGGANQVIINSAGTGANAVRINPTAGGVDVDAVGAIALDSTAGNSNFTVTNSGSTLTLAAAGGGANQVIINSAGTGANAVRINPTAGGMDVDAVGAIALDSTAGNSNFTVTNAGSTLTFAALGGTTNQLIMNSAGTGTNAISMNASAGGFALQTSSADRLLISSGGLISFNAASGAAGSMTQLTKAIASGSGARVMFTVTIPTGLHHALLVVEANTRETANNLVASVRYSVVFTRLDAITATEYGTGAIDQLNSTDGAPVGFAVTAVVRTTGTDSTTETADIIITVTNACSIIATARLHNFAASGITIA